MSWENWLFAYAITKTQISFTVTGKLISACFFRYMDSTIPLLPESEISGLYTSSVVVQPGLCQTWSETPKTGFLTTWFKLLAHLSQRLFGELIVYQWSGVRHHPSTFSNIFFSKTAWPIKAKFYVEPPWVGGTKVCSQYLGHMTKMAAIPIYGKNPSNIFYSRTGGPIRT